MIRKFDFEIYSDHYQFYLEDEASTSKTDEIWTDEAVGQMLATGENFVAVGTARYETVPVSVEFYDGEPLLQLEKYSRINECSLKVTSKRLVLAGCTEYLPDSVRIDVEPSIYRVRVLYGNLETVKDDWDGEDFYILQLWKDTRRRRITVIKS